MLCALAFSIFIYHTCFRDIDRTFHDILTAISIILLFVIAFWLNRNVNSKQLQRMMRQVGNKQLIYNMDGIAVVAIDDLLICYGLKKKKMDLLLETNNNVYVDVSCALPTDASAQEAFSVIKSDLDEVLEREETECVEYELKVYSFDLHIELQSKHTSVVTLQRIQQALVSVLINKYHLNTVKRYLKTVEKKNNTVFYWEFIGNHVTRSVCYDPQSQVWDNNEKVIYDLSDMTSDAVILTEQEFEMLYEQAVNSQAVKSKGNQQGFFYGCPSDTGRCQGRKCPFFKIHCKDKVSPDGSSLQS